MEGELTDDRYHRPVMLQECIDALDIQPGGTYVDVTFGGGGHSRAMLTAIGSAGRLIAFDRDDAAAANLPAQDNITLVNHDYHFLKKYLKYLGAMPADGILADLGVSSHQFDSGERGFSFRYDAPLDMRMDRANAISAKELLNSSSQDELQHIFSAYGEIKNARTLAKAIVERRAGGPLETTGDLATTAEDVMIKKESLKKYLAQVFQAVRIAVNDELGSLRSFLEQAAEVIKPGGRLVVLTYHSLEDRMVKNFIQNGNFDKHQEKDIYGNELTPWKSIGRKPLSPTAEEVEQNPRARSAKLRVAEKK